MVPVQNHYMVFNQYCDNGNAGTVDKVAGSGVVYSKLFHA
jgi:hypothetical protein